MKKIITSLVFSILFSGCSTNKYYPKEKVELLHIENQEDTLRIYYKAPLETMYYSSGVDYFYNNDSLGIKIVRAKIESQPKQMIKSYLTNRNNNKQIENNLGTYYIEIPNHFFEKSKSDFRNKVIVK